MKKACVKIKAFVALLCCVCVLLPSQIVLAAPVWGTNNLLDQEAIEVMENIVEDHPVLALVYLSSTQTLWADASVESAALAELPTGQTVFVTGACLDSQYKLWVEVDTYFQGESYCGYIPREYLACADEDFLQWEEEYVPSLSGGNVGMYLSGTEGGEEQTGEDQAGEDQAGTPTASPEPTTEQETGAKTSPDIEQFPPSYRDALYALKEQYPNWIFVRMDTGLNWDTVISNEMKNDRSLIYKSNPDYVKGEQYDDGNWYYPTIKVLEYYMDPRNGLTESRIFQFELLTYNETYHTQDAVRLFLDKTFMHSNQMAPGTEITYDLIFWAIGAELNVSPFHLASRVYQEQGQGKSDLISGKYPGYEGYYNYFNVKATGTTRKEIIERGLTYAKQQKWNSAYYSILGGSKLLSSSYITKGQDTIYLQKYNVNPNSEYALFTHQYMQNIVAPSAEGSTVRNMYHNVGALDNTFVFKIPVYAEMPSEACPYPSAAKEGWYEENGGWYWYENDVKQGLEGRGKEIYDKESDAWYWLDANEGGKKAVNKDVFMEKSGEKLEEGQVDPGKWVRYDEDGRMIKGEDYRYGGWYRFEQLTGAMVKGWYTTEENKTYYYDMGNGQMVHGHVKIDGAEYLFDPVTGVLVDCRWVTENGNEYWYEGGIKQGLEGRGKEIYDKASDAWYWLDSIDGGKKAVSKDVYQESLSAFPDRPDGTGKWVRYDENGHMVKGWHTNENGTYYFEPVTGAMAKGEVSIDGEIYYFDSATGILK